MKSVPTLLKQRDREIRSLKLELETSKADIERVRSDNRPYAMGKRPSRRRDSGYGTETSSPNSSISSAPSYARPTAASVSKSKARVVEPPVDGPQVEEEEDHVKVYGNLVYVDGQLFDAEAKQKLPGYMGMTLTSTNKMSWADHSDFLRRNKAVASWSRSIPSQTWATASWGDSVFKLAASEVIHIDASQMAIQSLVQRSGLQDNAFFSSPAGRVHIRLRTQLRLLKTAHRLTQDAVWYALRDRWTAGQKLYYPHGPRSVRFGRTELDRSIGLTVGQHLSYEVQKAVYGVIDLRNAIAHSEVHNSGDLDKMMQLAQSLVCRLGDEDRAIRIRHLRDKLKQKSKACYEDIVVCAGLSHLPEAQSQPVHHQSLYVEIAWELLSKKESDTMTRYGKEVVEAAKEWNAKHMSIGDDDPDDLGNVEK